MPDSEKLRIALATQGTRGDFQPFLCLARGLAARGHSVMIFGNPDHCKIAAEFGFQACVCAQEIKDLLSTEHGRKAMETGDLAVAFHAFAEDTTDYRPVFRETMDKFDPHLVLWSPLIGDLIGQYAVLRPELPMMSVILQPMNVPTDEVAPIVLRRVPMQEGQPNLSLWSMLFQFEARTAHMNLESGRAEGKSEDELMTWASPESIFENMWNREESPTPVIAAYSPAFWPKPVDWASKGVELVGRWMMNMDEQEASCAQANSSFFAQGSEQQVCADFINAGPAPVYIGWGSMTVHSHSHMARLAVEALMLAGQKGIVIAGWADLSNDSLVDAPNADELSAYCKDNVLFVKAAPHEWLFPQCKCCVHHGGIGTAQASLGAGSPTIVTPVFADQFDIADHITKHKWGIGTSRLPLLQPKELAEAISEVCTNPSYKLNVEGIAAKMRQEDGVGTTIATLEGFYRDKVLSGEWLRRTKEIDARIRERRLKTGKMLIDTKIGQLCSRLNSKYPSLKAWQEKQMKLFGDMAGILQQGKLFFVKGRSCLVRASEKLKSDEVGRFGTFAFLELLAESGSRMHVRLCRGSGPRTGWISPVVKGVDIVEKVKAIDDIAKIITMETTALFSEFTN